MKRIMATTPGRVVCPFVNRHEGFEPSARMACYTFVSQGSVISTTHDGRYRKSKGGAPPTLLRQTGFHLCAIPCRLVCTFAQQTSHCVELACPAAFRVEFCVCVSHLILL